MYFIKRLINICGQIQAGPTENEEVQFLCTVAAKLRMYPNLVNFFLEVTTIQNRVFIVFHKHLFLFGGDLCNFKVPKPSGMTSVQDSSPKTKERVPEKPQYRLVNSLLQLSKSEVCT